MPPKRKRPERQGDSIPRPSPHRPGDTSLGQHDRGYDGGRGNRGGRNLRRGDRRDSSNSYTSAPASSAAPGTISPMNPRPSSSSSSAPFVVANSTQPVTAPAPSAPLPPIQPGYFYAIITDNIVERWTQGARQEVIDHGIRSRQDEDLTEVTTIFQELLHSVADGRLSGADAGGLVKDIMGPEPSEADRAALVFDPHTLFLDTVSTFMDIEPDPFRPQLAEFMKATGVSPALMRLVLDPPILQQLDLIRDTFVRMGIRQSTNLLYRQANYNLLREETEGFSKLITELFTTCGTEPPSSEVVQSAFHRVMGLIGTFDLHPGRVLDVTLDVFAAVLIKQFRFFVKFLRVSSWWPRNQPKNPSGTFVGGLPVWALPDHFNWVASEEEEAEGASQRLSRDISFWERARKIKLDAFFELGGRQLSAADEERLANGEIEDSQETSIERDWVRLTKTLPPSGNRDAAQMLGFKLRFYASEARDAEDILPANLCYLIALLVRIGFISLTDIWNHVWPADEDIESVKAKKLKELDVKERERREGGEKNALMMAGALPDDMPPPPSTTSRRDAAISKPEADAKAAADAAEDNHKLPEPDDQKIILLRCLLTIGAIPESLFIIGRHPWMLQACPDDLLPLIFRILDQSIDSVFQNSRPAASVSLDIPYKALPDVDQSGLPKGSVRLSPVTPRRPLRWPFPDKADPSEGGIYRFYWDEWADNIPICQTVEDIFTLCDTLLNTVGVSIGRDPALVAKLTSIGAKSLADDPSPENKVRWLELLKRLLVPCLSLSKANSSAVNSVWELLKQYPIQARFNIYAEWYEGATSRLEPIQKAFAQTRLETLSKMKRLSLTNIPQMAKSLAKTAYASPGILCKVALLQIESYSNLIDAFVECVKYFTALGYDVLVWSVLSSIGGQRSRTQEGSVLLTSKWLQALSKFSGKVFQRYSNMNPTPILRYVNDQLFRGNSTDLLILRELIESMGGVVSDLDFTDAQLRAMTGGELLRRETLISLGDKRATSVRSADRLMKSLVETKLAGRLLVNIAQYRQNAIFKVMDGDAHVKYLASVLDDTHQILLQYLDLLRTNLDRETFSSLVPSIIQLMRDFGLDAGLAFMIGRASLRHDIGASKTKDSQLATQTSKSAADVDGDVSMDGSAAEITEPKSGIADEKVEADTRVANSRKPDPLMDALQPLIEEIPTVLPEQNWRFLNPVCYVSFWSLQLGDFSFPQESYSAESSKLAKQAEEVMKDRTDMTRAGMNKKTQKRNDILDRQKLLLKENNLEIERFSKSRLQIAKNLSNWFPAEIAKVDMTSDAFLEECILPRLHMSPLDAEYCFRLIKFLHEFSAPNFKLMSLYDRLLNHNRLRAVIFTCTVREAEHLGRFLRLILGDLSKWHGDKNAYEKEALGVKDLQGKKTRQYLGFATAFESDGKPTAFIEHDAYRDLLFRWHKELNSALRSCLNGLEWMHIRNAITVLKSVIDYFPAINFMADKFLEQLKTIAEREAASKTASESEQGHRVDLSVTAQTTFSELQRRKSKWILVQAFRPGLSNESKDEARSTPSTSSLRASAPEFKPPGSRKNPAEVEDGEVKDSRGTKAPDGPADNKVSTAPKPPAKDVVNEKLNVPPTTTALPIGKPAAPKPAPLPSSSQGNRTEQTRFSTLPPAGHGLPNRPELPSRPEVSYPSRGPNMDRFGQPRHDRRDAPRDSRDYREPRDGREGREARDSRDGREIRDSRESHSRDNREPPSSRESRDYRAGDPRPERPRDFPASDRRAGESNPRDMGRPDREWPNRSEPPPPRWNDHASGPDRENRQSRDRAPHGSGRDDPRPQREHAVSTPPAASAAKNDASEPPVNLDRLRRLNESDRPDIINPARVALITDSREPPRSNSSSRDQPRERPSRTDSPRRAEHQQPNPPPQENSRDDRHPRHRHSDYHGSGRDGHGDTPTSQSRPERNSEREPERGTSFRDAPYAGRGGESDQNRSFQQDPNYGRLNNIPSVGDSPSGAPSGPRGRGRNAARISSANGPSMRPDNRFSGPDPIRPPSPDRHPPTGPSSSRARRSQYDSSNGNLNSPTSVGPSPAAGIHLDRPRQTHPQQPPAAPSAPASGPPTPSAPSGIHPDRLKQIGTGSQAPGQNTGSRSSLSTPNRPPVTAPGSGSRPPAPPMADYPTPTGPSGSNDRMRPGGSRQLRGILNTLEKASVDSGRGPSSSRMGRLRTNLAGSDAQILAGSSPVTTPVQERPDPVRDAFRQDTANDRAPRPPPEPRPEPIQVVSDSRDDRGGRNNDDHSSSRGDHERSNRRDHHRSDRSNRPSRRSSRERTPDRDRDMKDREYRDRRDNTSGGALINIRESERDTGGSRRSMRDSSGGGRDSLPGGRDMGPPREPMRESGHRGHRGDGPPSSRNDVHSNRDNLGGRGGDEYGNSGRSGSSRGTGGPRDSRTRLGDERNDPRGDDRGRKRRSEGPTDPVHQDKRPRR